MTLLEQFDAARYWEDMPDSNAVRRALAIAQAVDERVEEERAKADDCRSMAVIWIMNRTDELLKEGK